MTTSNALARLPRLGLGAAYSDENNVGFSSNNITKSNSGTSPRGIGSNFPSGILGFNHAGNSANIEPSSWGGMPWKTERCLNSFLGKAISDPFFVRSAKDMHTMNIGTLDDIRNINLFRMQQPRKKSGNKHFASSESQGISFGNTEHSVEVNSLKMNVFGGVANGTGSATRRDILKDGSKLIGDIQVSRESRLHRREIAATQALRVSALERVCAASACRNTSNKNFSSDQHTAAHTSNHPYVFCDKGASVGDLSHSFNHTAPPVTAVSQELEEPQRHCRLSKGTSPIRRQHEQPDFNLRDKPKLSCMTYYGGESDGRNFRDSTSPSNSFSATGVARGVPERVFPSAKQCNPDCKFKEINGTLLGGPSELDSLRCGNHNLEDEAPTNASDGVTSHRASPLFIGENTDAANTDVHTVEENWHGFEKGKASRNLPGKMSEFTKSIKSTAICDFIAGKDGLFVSPELIPPTSGAVIYDPQFEYNDNCNLRNGGTEATREQGNEIVHWRLCTDPNASLQRKKMEQFFKTGRNVQQENIDRGQIPTGSVRSGLRGPGSPPKLSAPAIRHSGTVLNSERLNDNETEVVNRSNLESRVPSLTSGNRHSAPACSMASLKSGALINEITFPRGNNDRWNIERPNRTDRVSHGNILMTPLQEYTTTLNECNTDGGNVREVSEAVRQSNENNAFDGYSNENDGYVANSGFGHRPYRANMESKIKQMQKNKEVKMIREKNCEIVGPSIQHISKPSCLIDRNFLGEPSLLKSLRKKEVKQMCEEDKFKENGDRLYGVLSNPKSDGSLTSYLPILGMNAGMVCPTMSAQRVWDVTLPPSCTCTIGIGDEYKGGGVSIIRGEGQVQLQMRVCQSCGGYPLTYLTYEKQRHQIAKNVIWGD